MKADSDFAGIADDIYDAFKLGRAAIVAKNYTVRDEQVEILREKISMIIGIRAVYYLQGGKSKFRSDLQVRFMIYRKALVLFMAYSLQEIQ